jgi:hypothetical protein
MAGLPVLGQVGSAQLTDVVETANASMTAIKLFLTFMAFLSWCSGSPN